jgi:putative SOS response-associated peptidase YedK
MCGRYTLRTAPEDLVNLFQFAESDFELAPRYNIAPTQDVAAVRWNADQNQRELGFLYWGLIPFWAKDAKIGGRMINARSETIAEKPSFRHAFVKKRCLILADGFYEWQKLAGGTKQPFYIHRQDDQPFALAGLWESWKNEGRVIESCTIITTTANETMQPLHDRMPVILSANDYDRWLDPLFQEKAALQELLKPCAADLLEAYPLSTRVNNARNQEAQCIERMESRMDQM